MLMKDYPFDLRFQDVGGAELPYLFFAGESSAGQMIFMHATGFLPWLWQPIIAEFVPPNNVWAPFICDYRLCVPEKGGLNWDTIARDLASFCRAQKIYRPLLIGHSMGATVLTIAAALYDLNPCGIILIEPIFLPDKIYETNISLKDHPLASRAVKRTNSWKNEAEALAYFKSKSLFAGWDEQILQLYVEYGLLKQKDGKITLTCTPESEAAIFMGGRENNPWPLLKKINCPVLLIEGEESEIRQFVDFPRALSLLPKGKYKLIAAAGHLIPMQKPKELIDIIKEFGTQCQ